MAGISPKKETDATQDAIKNLLNPSQKPKDVKQRAKHNEEVNRNAADWVRETYPALLYINFTDGSKLKGAARNMPTHLFIQPFAALTGKAAGLAVYRIGDGDTPGRAEVRRRLSRQGWLIRTFEYLEEFKTIVNKTYGN